jgi:hypothetical protein
MKRNRSHIGIFRGWRFKIDKEIGPPWRAYFRNLKTPIGDDLS